MICSFIRNGMTNLLVEYWKTISKNLCSKEAEIMRSNGINIIIALGHSGIEIGTKVAESCPLVDVVVGGHSHTFLYTGNQPDIEKVEGPYPTVVTQPTGKRVPVVQSYAFAKYLGILKLVVSISIYHDLLVKVPNHENSSSSIFFSSTKRAI